MIVALGLGHLVEFEIFFLSVSVLFLLLSSIPLFSHTPYPFPDFVSTILLFPSFLPFYFYSLFSVPALVGLPFFVALFNSYFLLLFLISLFGTYTFDFSKLSPLARKEAGYLIYEPAGCRINPFYFICFSIHSYLFFRVHKPE